MLENKVEMRSITDAGCKARQDRRSSNLEPKTGGKVLAFRRDGTKGRTVNMLGLRGNAPLGGKQAGRSMTQKLAACIERADCGSNKLA